MSSCVRYMDLKTQEIIEPDKQKDYIKDKIPELMADEEFRYALVDWLFSADDKVVEDFVDWFFSGNYISLEAEYEDEPVNVYGICDKYDDEFNNRRIENGGLW